MGSFIYHVLPNDKVIGQKICISIVVFSNNVKIFATRFHFSAKAWISAKSPLALISDQSNGCVDERKVFLLGNY